MVCSFCQEQPPTSPSSADQGSPERDCHHIFWNVWVLDFVLERFHYMSPGDFESMSVRAGDNEKRKGLR